MIESLIMSTEILQRPKKKNVIFEKTIVFRFVLIFISASAVTPVPTFAAKTMTKTMKPVRQKLINEVRAKADLYRVILRMLDQPFSTIIREFLANSTDLQRVIQKSYFEESESDEKIAIIIVINIITDINYIR